MLRRLLVLPLVPFVALALCLGWALERLDEARRGPRRLPPWRPSRGG